MIELPLIFVGGLLGSAHCIGMCGPLALSLGASTPEGTSPLARQVVFSFGRLFTYCCFGAVAGYTGAWLSHQSNGFAVPQAWLAIAAGLALLCMGLATTGYLPRPAVRALSSAPCGVATWLKTYLSSPGLTGPLLAGVFTGFIPCGLVYAFLLKSGSAGGLWMGWLTMAAFGLGTFPLMILLGYGGRMLPVANRARLMQVAAWCVVVTGAISVARGAYQLRAIEDPSAAPCPLCVAEAAESGGPAGLSRPGPEPSTPPRQGPGQAR